MKNGLTPFGLFCYFENNLLKLFKDFFKKNNIIKINKEKISGEEKDLTKISIKIVDLVHEFQKK